MARRRGFTLVETIVALVLLEIAMLALAATAGLAARDLSDAMLRRRAHSLATGRAESLRAGACAGISSGSRPIGAGMTEYWKTEAMGSARSVTDSISIRLSRGVHAAAVARAWVLCA